MKITVNEKIKDRGCWFVLKGVDEQEAYDWFSDAFVEAEVTTYDPDPVGGYDGCGIELDITLSVAQTQLIFQKYSKQIKEFAINEAF